MTGEELDARLAELERADRLEDAALLAESAEQHARAAELWERACRFERAAAAALRAGDGARALVCAARAGDSAIADAAIRSLSVAGDGRRVADRLVASGHPAYAARLRQALGDALGAARDFEAAGALLAAATEYDRGGDPRSAARCLELELGRDDANHAARLALGELLARHGRLERAVSVLQRIPGRAPERPRALAGLQAALSALGLSEAVREVEAELAELGGAPAPAPPTGPALDAVAVAPAAPAPRVLFGRYQVVADVASTPTARVLHALDRVSGEAVAVKIFAPTLRESGRDALERFEREARALGQLRHPAIVPLVAYLPEAPAVVLRWMDGGSLADLLTDSAISPARAVEITTSVLAALGEAHRRGILHRDIKPANVLFDGAGAAHLADFGTAHVADSAATVTAGVLGTIAYMAPEQRAGRPASISSDVYGAGALLWHALTGGPPDAKLDFLSAELGAEHHAIARRMIAPEDERPGDTIEARRLLASIAWPRAVPAPRAFEPQTRASDETSLRLVAKGGVLYEDSLLGRDVYVLSADETTLARVLPFARAGHPALACVLAHRPEDATLWIEAVSGEPPTTPLDATDRATLAAALAALHRAGGTHGAVDRDHIVRRGDAILLTFPLAPTSTDPAADLAALEAL